MTATALAITPIEDKDIMKYIMSDATIKKTTKEEQTKFINLCVAYQLNPVKNEIYAVPYGNKITPIISYKMYIVRAMKTWLVKSWKVTLQHDDKRFPISATVTINIKWRDESFTFTSYMADCNWTSPLWKNQPGLMLRKTAIKQAFELAFPEAINLPVDDGIDDQWDIDATEDAKVDFTPADIKSNVWDEPVIGEKTPAPTIIEAPEWDEKKETPRWDISTAQITTIKTLISTVADEAWLEKLDVWEAVQLWTWIELESTTHASKEEASQLIESLKKMRTEIWKEA